MEQAQRYHRKSRSFPPVFSRRKVLFQRNISVLVSEHDIPPSLIINIDQTLLSYVNTGKYTFSFKSTKNVPIKGVDDNCQITATFAVSCTGEFFPANLWRENRMKSAEVLLSTFFSGNVHRKSLVKHREIY